MMEIITKENRKRFEETEVFQRKIKLNRKTEKVREGIKIHVEGLRNFLEPPASVGERPGLAL
jgi:hypothetical protein